MPGHDALNEGGRNPPIVCIYLLASRFAASPIKPGQQLQHSCPELSCKFVFGAVLEQVHYALLRRQTHSKSTSAAASAARIMDPPGQPMSMEELGDMLHRTAELQNGGKITPNTAWNLSFIQHIPKLIEDVESGSDFSTPVSPSARVPRFTARRLRNCTQAFSCAYFGAKMTRTVLSEAIQVCGLAVVRILTHTTMQQAALPVVNA